MSRPLLLMLLVSFLTAACGESRNESPIVSSEFDPVRNWLDESPGQNGPSNARAAARPVAPVGQMIEGLANRLEKQPDDVDGWRLLAQSYAYVGDMDKARAAADRAVMLGADEGTVSAAVRAAHTDRSR